MRKEKKAPWLKIIFSNFFASIFFFFFSPSDDAVAQINCKCLQSIKAKTARTYPINAGLSSSRMKIVLSCTDTDNTAQVKVLGGDDQKQVIQTFQIEQQEDYLQALFPDVDKDGYQDMVVVTAHGNPDLVFNVWRFDPVKKEFSLVLDDSGFYFYRSRFNDLIIYSKGGAGYWNKRFLVWQENKLAPKFNIEIQNEAIKPSDCKYRDESSDEEIVSGKLLNKLSKYCSQNVDREVREFFLGEGKIF